jgi:hypothetical protein
MRTSYFVAIIIFTDTIVAQRSPGIEEFVETFDGTGPYASTDGSVVGFDNPDWVLNGTGSSFQEGGLRLANRPVDDHTDGDVLYRWTAGRGSFISAVDVKNFDVDLLDPPVCFGDGGFLLRHGLDPPEGGTNSLDIWIYRACRVPPLPPDRWGMGIRTGNDFIRFFEVPAGPHVRLTISFDDSRLEALYTFDNDIGDDVPAISFGPYKYVGTISETQAAELVASANEAQAYQTSLVDFWSLTCTAGSVQADFNHNGSLDTSDIDLLSAAFRNGSSDPVFDLNCDAFVTSEDRTAWVTKLARTYFGDSNLDGEFNTLDLVSIFQAGEYDDELERNSTWATGDWSGDAEFNSRDLVFAFQEGGYEIGPRSAIASVPEPALATFMLSLAVVGGFFYPSRPGRARSSIGGVETAKVTLSN